jgi:ABC-type transport system involved in multi-copper enzyme maturation permease subunit
VLLGRWIGESAALAGAIVVGCATGAVIVAFSSGTGGLLRFVFFVAASIALGTIFLSMAAAIASATDKRVTALGVGTFVWFFFVLLYDAGALSALAGSQAQSGAPALRIGLPESSRPVRIAILSVSAHAEHSRRHRRQRGFGPHARRPAAVNRGARCMDNGAAGDWRFPARDL